MKIMLITPTIHRTGMERVSPFWLPPLSLATIAGLTPKGIEIKLIDENVEDIDFNEEVDLVAISFLTTQANRAYQIADMFRKRNVCVVLGGYHPSAVPEESKQHADSVIIGEAEVNWVNMLNDFRNKQLQPFYRNEQFPSLDNIPLPRRDLYKKDKYLTINTIQTSKGCPYKCEFCNVSTFFGRKYRTKPIEAVVREIESMKSEEGDIFFFVDDEIMAEKKRAMEMFKAIRELNIKWWSQATIRNMTSDDELLRLARESGCTVMVVGLESLLAENLESIGKYQNELGKFEEQIAKIQDMGITLNPSFTFGNDGDNLSVFENTLEFLERNKIAIATFNILTPLPNTPLYSRLEAEGRILIRDWSKYDMGHCVFKPANMTPEELEEGFNKITKEFYSFSAIKKRLQYVDEEKRTLIFGWNMGYKRLLDTFGVLM